MVKSHSQNKFILIFSPTLVLLLMPILICGCAGSNIRSRFLMGAGLGAAGGATAGATFSPNSESRLLNALVFGAGGALLGGALGLMSDPKTEVPASQNSLKEREKQIGGITAKEFQLQSESSLPPFVRERLLSPVIEEWIERDRVSEDGSLHEPHKVYRIIRPAELFSKTKNVEENTKKEKLHE